MKDGIKRVATFCVLRHNDNFLLLQRYKEPHKGKLVPVGGKLEAFETPTRAVIRETLEETGITIQQPKYCGTLVETSPTPYNWISFVYLAEIEHMSPPLCNEGILTWINCNEIDGNLSPLSDVFIYQYILKNEVFALNAEYDENIHLLKLTNDLTSEVIYDIDGRS